MGSWVGASSDIVTGGCCGLFMLVGWGEGGDGVRAHNDYRYKGTQSLCQQFFLEIQQEIDIMDNLFQISLQFCILFSQRLQFGV